MTNEAIFRAMYSRKSVRNFTDAPVEKHHLEKMIRAGMSAPTARNLQPWEFIVLTEKTVLKQLAEQLPYAKMLADVPAAIIVAGDSQVVSPSSGLGYWVQDCSAATQNILLAAEALGYGAVWTALYPYDERIMPVREACELPQKIIPLNIIPVGVPTGKDTPKEKWDPSKIHWEKWQK